MADFGYRKAALRKEIPLFLGHISLLGKNQPRPFPGKVKVNSFLALVEFEMPSRIKMLRQSALQEKSE